MKTFKQILRDGIGDYPFCVIINNLEEEQVVECIDEYERQFNSMAAISWAVKLEQKYNQMDFDKMIKEFNHLTRQNVPLWVKDKFKLSGLDKIDFLTSDFLNKWGFKNLLQI